MSKTFEEIAEEVKRQKQWRKGRKAYLDQVAYVQRYMDKVCWCGRKHDGATKTCRQCRETKEPEITMYENW